MTNVVASMISGGQGFFQGAVVLGHALNRQAKGYKKLLLVEKESYTTKHLEYLEQVGWVIREVPALRTKPTEFAASRWPQTFTKLNLWNLDHDGYVLYMDADACPFSPIDPFFEYQPKHVAATSTKNYRGRFRSGLMLFRPNKEVFSDLEVMLQDDPTKNGAKLGDQGLLNIYFKDKFDLFPDYYHLCDWYKCPQHIIVGHLRPKPWQTRKGHPRMRPYTTLWRVLQKEALMKYGPYPPGK